MFQRLYGRLENILQPGLDILVRISHGREGHFRLIRMVARMLPVLRGMRPEQQISKFALKVYIQV